MAILGVLLGITMTVLGGCIWYGRREYIRCEVTIDLLQESLRLAEHRIAVLEKRKAAAEPIPGAKAVDVAPVPVRRRWNPDVEAANA